MKLIGVDSILATFVTICLAFAVTHGLHSHDETIPLRGYQCKQNAQRPCELCEPGYYCPTKHKKLPCGGAHYFCELGSVSPTQVSDGHYSVNGDEEHRSDEQRCEKGYFCVRGVKQVCPPGFFCPEAGMSEPLECGESVFTIHT
jgi:hypothetical protein